VTYQLNTGIPDDLGAELQAYASARGISIAAAVRVILHDRLMQGRTPGGGWAFTDAEAPEVIRASDS
jgi:hypothetical protein